MKVTQNLRDGFKCTTWIFENHYCIKLSKSINGKEFWYGFRVNEEYTAESKYSNAQTLKNIINKLEVR